MSDCTLYPAEYFNPKVFGSDDINITDNTYSIHHYSLSWAQFGIKDKIKISIKKIVGKQEDAQDILQETYTEIIKSIAQLKEPERFLSWAGMIANRKCFAFINKNKRDVLIHKEDTLFDDLQEDENLIPENVMQNKEMQRLVREMIDNLSEMQKLCIVAYYYNEKKQEEIAQELAIPLNSVKSHLYRARTKIKEQTLELEKEEGTRLYAITALLLLFLTEDMADCKIPEELTKRIQNWTEW